MILKMSFLKLNNTNVLFGKKILMQRFYTNNKVLITTKQVQIINPKEFKIATLDIDSKIFVVHMAI